jgi:hypothetical protein
LGGSWWPHAENVDIPIGILMVLRCPGPPRSHENARIPENTRIHETMVEFNEVPLNLVEIMEFNGNLANGVSRIIEIP